MPCSVEELGAFEVPDEVMREVLVRYLDVLAATLAVLEDLEVSLGLHKCIFLSRVVKMLGFITDGRF